MVKPQSGAWLITIVTNAVILACGVLTGILMARLLHPEGRGVLASILFWPELFAAFGICGLNEAVVYRVSHGSRADDTTITAAVCAIVLAAATSICGILLMPLLLRGTGASWAHAASLYVLCFIPLNFLALTLLAVDQGQLRFQRYNLIRLSVPLIYAAGLVGLWALGAVRVETVLWANLAGNAVCTAIRIAMSRTRSEEHTSELQSLRHLV